MWQLCKTDRAIDDLHNSDEETVAKLSKIAGAVKDIKNLENDCLLLIFDGKSSKWTFELD